MKLKLPIIIIVIAVLSFTVYKTVDSSYKTYRLNTENKRIAEAIKNSKNVQKTLDVLKQVQDYSNDKAIGNKISSISDIKNPIENLGDEILINYSKRIIRNEMVYSQNYNYNISNVLSDKQAHFISNKGYSDAKCKCWVSYPPSINITIIDSTLLSDIDKEKVQYGLNILNKGVVVALVFPDGLYLYQVDKDGKKENELEYSTRNNVKLKEVITPELAREGIVLKFKCSTQKVKMFDDHPDVRVNGESKGENYYSIGYSDEKGIEKSFLVNKHDGNVYEYLPIDVCFNLYDIDGFK